MIPVQQEAVVVPEWLVIRGMPVAMAVMPLTVHRAALLSMAWQGWQVTIPCQPVLTVVMAEMPVRSAQMAVTVEVL